MNYIVSKEQIVLKEKYASFCKKEIAPHAMMLDSGKEDEVKKIIIENIKKLAAFGYMGSGHEKQQEGQPVDLISQLIAGEELAKACSSTFLSARASCEFFGYQLKHFGTDQQKEKYLPEIIKGNSIGCLGITEAEAGSDEADIKTAAVKKGNTWVLNGTKTFITNAPIADVCLIMACTDKESGAQSGMTTFLLSSKTNGLSFSKSFDMLGYRGSPIGEIYLNDCEVSDDAVVGKTGQGLLQNKQMTDFYRLSMAVAALGIAVRCMEESNNYSKQRKVSGRLINRYQEVSFKLADMMILTDMSRLLLYKAAWEKENNNPEAGVLISCAKLFTSEAATQIANMAVQIHGGAGYKKGSIVEKLYRDAKFGEIGQGTSEILRTSIARSVLEKYAR